MEDERYRPLFLAEASERIEAIERALAGGPPYPPQALGEVRLQAHTLGGMAAAMHEPELAETARQLESAAGAEEDGALPEAAARLRALLLANRSLRR